ncbi:MAG: O-antigen ligase family protein [Bacteroidales bacterium]|jgi:5S rRNA maturation endonuclease (ribonuclease M5)|nr:O-antigen ligase family protein [Bacteroidales bacterium]
MQIKDSLIRFVDYRTKNRIIFLFALALFLLGIPFSRFLMSLGGTILVINWFIGGNPVNSIKKIFHSKVVLSCLILYIVHLLWVFPSQNIHYGIADLWIKIPLLFIPIIFYTNEPLSRKELHILLQIYILGTFISSFSGFITYLIKDLSDKREMALFISYLRFEINICFVCFVCLFLLLKERIAIASKVVIGVAFCWFLFFLIYSGSITAIGLFFIIAPVFIVQITIANKHKFLRYFIPSLFAIIVAGVGVVLFNCVRRYFHVDFSIETAAKYTADGNPYFHEPQKRFIENGSYIYTYISDIELKEAWNKRSEINFTDLDGKGFPIRITLIRYLNSKGLHKDRLGVETLSEQDVHNVEQGIANVAYTHRLNIINRIYCLIWELNDYYYTGGIIGYSIPQRIELWKHSVSLIKKHPLWGVGTGDVKDAFAEELQLNNSPLTGTNMRSHNQYFTFLIAFGIIGLALILFSIIYPPLALRKMNNFLFLVFFSIVIISMLTEDTLEPQDGVTFFAFFYSFFLFLFPKPVETNTLLS